MAQGRGLAIARWLDLSVTQGAADGFIEGTVATNIVPEDGLILKVTAIALQFPQNFSVLAADYAAFWSFTRDTKTNVPNIDDPDVFLSDSFNVGLVTSGMFTASGLFRYNDLSGIYLVEPDVYFQLDTVGGTAAYSAHARIFYEEVAASEIDILRITNNS